MQGIVELWYDVETTGLYIPQGAAVVQFAGILVKDDEVIAEINLNINPLSYNRETTVDQVALDINGHSVEDFPNYDTLELALAKIMDMLTKLCPDDKVTMIGYNNSAFDKYFIEDMFNDQGKSYNTYIRWKQLDVFELVKMAVHMEIMEKPFNQKLGTVAESLGLEPEGSLHDALVDVKLTRQIYLKMKEFLCR